MLLFSCANKNFLFWRLSNDCQIVRPALVSGPPNRKKPYNKHLISIVFSVRTVNYEPSFRNLQYRPKTRLIRSIYSLRSRPKKKGGAREGDTRGEREGLPGRPTKIVSTRILWVRIFPIIREAPEGKINRAGRENCQSIVHGQRNQGLMLHHQLLKPLNGVIEVQVSEVTSVWFNGTMWL